MTLRPATHRFFGTALLAAAVALPCGAAERMPAVGAIDTAVGDLPTVLQQVGFDQNLGQSVPLDITVRDETGAEGPLSRFFGEKPAVLVPAYYECPMLCTMVINDLTSALRVVGLTPADDFNIVVYSIDPGETPEMATAAKNTAVGRYDGGDGSGWHFLTADQASIESLSEAIGFQYYYDEKSGEYAHSAGIVVVTPEGTIARYFFGLEYPPRELRLALVEAADEKIGSLSDKLMLFCFQWDPATGRYSALTLNIVRLGAVITLLGLAFLVGFLIMRERTSQQNLGTV